MLNMAFAPMLKGAMGARSLLIVDTQIPYDHLTIFRLVEFTQFSGLS